MAIRLVSDFRVVCTAEADNGGKIGAEVAWGRDVGFASIMSSSSSPVTAANGSGAGSWSASWLVRDLFLDIFLRFLRGTAELLDVLGCAWVTTIMKSYSN
jgi:hypothetical protein